MRVFGCQTSKHKRQTECANNADQPAINGN
ncbi:Uncharacterised protein [Vibrio cholerae]|nr:Uncharacterised protein [Vibrio cholerae]